MRPFLVFYDQNGAPPSIFVRHRIAPQPRLLIAIRAHHHDGNGLAETAPMRVFRVLPLWRRGLIRRRSVVVSNSRWNSSGLPPAQRAAAATSPHPMRTFPSSGRSAADRMVVFGSRLARFEFFPQNPWMPGVVHGVVPIGCQQSAVGDRRSAVGGRRCTSWQGGGSVFVLRGGRGGERPHTTPHSTTASTAVDAVGRRRAPFLIEF